MTSKVVINATSKVVTEPTLAQAEVDQKAAELASYEAGALDRALVALRTKRNALLVESDPMMLSDHPDNIRAGQAAIETYRTLLRNITSGLTTVESVDAVVMPTKP